MDFSLIEQIFLRGGGTMEERALRRSFGWFIFLVLPLVLILGAVPCAAEETYTLQDLLVAVEPIPIDNLRFSDFSVPYSNSSDSIPIDLSNISVTTIGEGTLKPGLKFDLNGELSVTASIRTLIISYTVTHLGGDFIEGSTLNLGELSISGNHSLVMVEEKTAYGQIDTATRHVLYKLYQNQSTQLWDGKLKTPQAVLRPTVSLQVKGEASIDSFEQKFTLTPAPGTPMANAGVDQAVFDQVSLDGSDSSPADATYQWELYQKGENGWELFASAPGVQAEFTNLVNGFYEARLTVTNSLGVSAVDTAIIAAAGPSGAGTEPKIEEVELNLWNFELKKYKYCRWSTARMLGTFDLPDDFEFKRGDDLVGKVTVEISREGEPVIVMSDDLKLKVKNRKYKSLIHGHGR